MSGNVLERLKSEGFAVSVGFLSTPSPLRRFLTKSSEVTAVRRALKQGAITEDTLRRFVSGLMTELRPGERFPHELVLAALAVSLEQSATDFADEFLHDLASLKLAELGLCVQVARECLGHRDVTEDTIKSFQASRVTGIATVSIETFGEDVPLQAVLSHAGSTHGDMTPCQH